MAGASLLLLALLPSAAEAQALSAVRCTRPVCPKGQRAVRRPGAPKIWAAGCNVTTERGDASAVHRCCVEKEICTRTCGMPWDRCSGTFERCAGKACGADEDCAAAARAADALISGGDSHMAVCKIYRDTQRELCDCLPLKDAKAGATERLAAFYAAYRPDRLDGQGNVRDLEEVWKKWQGREPELFFELTRKYSAEAVEIRPWSEEVLTSREAERARREAAAERAREAEELAQRSAEEELSRLQEQEAARGRAEAELEQRREEVVRIRREKAAAIAEEDYMLAKALKARLQELDPKGEL